MGIPLLTGLLPLPRGRGQEVLAGVTLAMLAVPEALGYARIAGMPVVTGLYTMLLPMVVFALFCSSRHLVIGADSATAAMLAAGLAGMAAAGGDHYVELAGTLALMVGVLLVAARLIGVGFLADFLSRTVLIGFLAGVGIHVAFSQLTDMLGMKSAAGNTLVALWHVLSQLDHIDWPTALTSAAVIAVVLLGRVINRRIPGPLIAVVGAIVAAHLLDLGKHGVKLVGDIPAGLPGFTLPALAPSDLAALLPIALSMVVVILAQSSATSRAYADRFDEQVDSNLDLVALGGANVAAAVTGTFVVDGSPTKTQMVVGAGGRTQLAQLAAVLVAVVVCLVATGLLAALPLAALAAVVFLIGFELIDLAGLRRIFAVRRSEMGVALLAAAAVVLLGVEQGIMIAVAISIINHLKYSYRPDSAVLVGTPGGHWDTMPVAPGARSGPGLVIYRFGSEMYFANAARLRADVETLTSGGPPLRLLCLDAAAIVDVDYSAGEVLTRVVQRVQSGGVRVVMSEVHHQLRPQLDRYGLTAVLGPDGYLNSSEEAYADPP